MTGLCRSARQSPGNTTSTWRRISSSVPTIDTVSSGGIRADAAPVATDAVMAKVMADERMKNSDMPFDGKRMIFGGFQSFIAL